MQTEQHDNPPIAVELRPARAPSYAALVTLCGQHHLATSDYIAEALSGIAGTILVDLSECEFIDSAAIGALLTKSERLKREGHRFELNLGPTPTFDVSSRLPA